MKTTNTDFGYRERTTRPLVWWEIASLGRPGDLVFLGAFEEVLGEATVSLRLISQELRMADLVHPVEDFMIVAVADLASDPDHVWGEHGAIAQRWFAAAESPDRDWFVEDVTASPLSTAAAWLRGLTRASA